MRKTTPLQSLFDLVQSPEQPAARGSFPRARQAYEKGDYAASIRFLDPLLAAADDSPDVEALRWRGRAFRELGDYEQAIADFTRVLTSRPELAGSYAELARTFYLAGRTEQALGTLASGIVRLEGSLAASLFRERGRIVARTGQYRKAIDDFTLAIYYQRRDAEAWLLRALAYAAVGDQYSAARDSDEAHRLAPADYRPLYVRAQIHFRTGHGRLALPLLSRAIELAPDAPNPVGLLGQILVALGDYAQAMAFLDKAIELGDQRPPTLAAKEQAELALLPKPVEELKESTNLHAVDDPEEELWNQRFLDFMKVLHHQSAD